ncbi:DUF2339 domain-containing protein [soil metagenome]
MSQPQQAAFARLSDEFVALSHQLSRVAVQLKELEQTLPAPVPAPPPLYYYPPPPPPSRYVPPPPPPYVPPRIAPPSVPKGRSRWIGKVLAVAGVAVTLIGVVLLLVLAAQAGILAPPVRVGAGAVLAAGLVGVGVLFNRRTGGRIGGIALAATGIAAAYMDVIAVTTIYHWAPPVIGLLIASAIGGGGLTLARRWNSQHLALLVLVPLAVLAPIVSDGVTVLLIGFMLALSAASLPVQLGKDWVLMHAARTLVVTLPLVVALLAAGFGSEQNPWLLGGACGVAALLAVAGALLVLPGTTRRVAIAVLTAVGVAPALAAAVAVDRVLAVLLAAVIAAGMLAIVLLAPRLPGVTPAVAIIWSALSAVAALVAVTVAFDGEVEAPVLLALALVVAVAGRHSAVARWLAIGFVFIGGLVFLGYAPPSHLSTAVTVAPAEAVSILAASALLIACAVVICWTWTPMVDQQVGKLWWAGALVITIYAVTSFTVTLGVLVGGRDGGFLAGHMAATICWIALAAALLVYALRVGDRDARTAPIAGGLALTAAATAKLMLFDLGTLDGIFRVVVFIVVGLVLLAMGAGYARSLAQQDDPSATRSADPQQRDASPTVTDETAHRA